MAFDNSFAGFGNVDTAKSDRIKHLVDNGISPQIASLIASLMVNPVEEKTPALLPVNPSSALPRQNGITDLIGIGKIQTPPQSPRGALPSVPAQPPRGALPSVPAQPPRGALPSVPAHPPRGALPSVPAQSPRGALPSVPGGGSVLGKLLSENARLNYELGRNPKLAVPQSGSNIAGLAHVFAQYMNARNQRGLLDRKEQLDMQIYEQQELAKRREQARKEALNAQRRQQQIRLGNIVPGNYGSAKDAYNNSWKNRW